jgi:multidrug efflux system membrane fusion protein
VFEWLDNLYRRVMPGFWLRMKPQYQWAAGIAVVVVLWIASGVFGHSGGPSDEAQAKVDDTPEVQVSVLHSVLHDATITIRGKTEAQHSVDVRAEVEGVVQALHFEKGDMVKKGQVLCEIKLNARGAMADQANALVAQRAKEYEVAAALYKDGYRSKTQMAQAEAALSAAKASANSMIIQVEDTRIRAPYNGFANDRYVEVGDYMRPGDKCAQVIAPEPFLAVGTVSEEEVGQIAVGETATAKLVTGEIVHGTVTFVASKSDPQTRTFEVEVTIPNADNKLRDGVSADITIPVRRVPAQHVSPGILVLDDNGVVGVRVVNNNIVHFRPIKLISDAPDGSWIAGLPDNTSVITVGQNYVNEGQRVKVAMNKRGT